MGVTEVLTCVLLAGPAGGVAGWWTARRMLGRGPRPGGTMRAWPGPGAPHGPPPDEGRRLGRARRRARRPWWVRR